MWDWGYERNQISSIFGLNETGGVWGAKSEILHM